MKQRALLLTLLSFFSFSLNAQRAVTPPVKNKFLTLTSHSEIKTYIGDLDTRSDLLTTEAIGRSVQGRDLYALKYSRAVFGGDPSQLKVLIFAQQHGNEQSGKEAALLFAEWLLKPENQYLFDRIDLALIPQVNPDGAAVNRRRNANDVDLNRNHLIMTEPETMSLHRFFDRYQFEMTLDVHEYSPYSDAWKKFGYRKSSEVTLGTLTNINISPKIRELGGNGYLPFLLDYTRKQGFSSFEYCPGGPPGEAYLRRSTFDVNDGRQSLGIEHTFSFIQEGMNGLDDSTENLQRRTEGQLAGMQAFLLYAFDHAEEIKTLTGQERARLLEPEKGQMISIQCDHFADGRIFHLPLRSYHTGLDTTVEVKDYRPVVKTLHDVAKPDGYLIPKDCTLLTDWVTRHGFKTEKPTVSLLRSVRQYLVMAIDSMDFEGDIIVNPTVELQEMNQLPGSEKVLIQKMLEEGDYLFLPVSQPKGNLIVLALEPKSELGLVTYPAFAHLLKVGNPFPVLRVER